MGELRLTRFKRVFHVVDGDHGKRAAVAMTVIESGGHAEIYENLDELFDAAPTRGAVLIADPAEDASGLVTRLYAGRVFLPVILFAENPSPSRVVQAAHDGIADFLAWPFADEELLKSYDYAQRYMEQNSAAILRQQRAQDRIAELTDREKQVLAFLLEGYSNKGMGIALDLSPRTIEDYRLNALRKLGVSSTSAAIRIGVEAGVEALRDFFTAEASTAPAAISLS